MALTFYWYPNCSTCKNAKKWLEDEGIEFTPVHLIDETPTKEEIKTLIEISKKEPHKKFNTRIKVYQKNNLKKVNTTDTLDEKTTLLAGNGMLIKRPILTDREKETVGYKEVEYGQVWK